MLASLRTVRRQPSSQWLILGIVSIIFAVYLLYNWARTPNTMLEPGSHLHYQTVEGFFLQSDTATDPHKLDPTKENFGLIDRTYFTDAEFDPDHEKTQWERFEHFVKHMNDASSDDEAYKVLFLGRHGEGYHNLAEEFYGTNEWDCYWSKENGNATIQWVDSDLSPHGVLQVEDLSKFWETALKELKVPAPESYYTSPLSRCLQTAELTFSELDLPSEAPFKPIVKELLRERIGIHTCDKRSTRSWIEENYPNYDVEYDLTEEDELWDPDVRESNSAQDARLKILLDSIFVTDTSSFISITSHGGATHAILTAVKHRPFELNTAGVLPVLVKAEKWNVEIHPPHIDPPTLAPECEKKNPAIVHELSDKEREFESEKFEE